VRTVVFGIFLVACGPAEKVPASAAAAHPAPQAGPPVASLEPKVSARGARHRIELGRYAVEVDADDGGRITEFSLEGKNVLATQSDSPIAYGSSFWPSPQSDWDWPPPPELDRMPWTTTVDDKTLVLESTTNAALGLAAGAKVSFDPELEQLNIAYKLTNHGVAPRHVAPWQNTRVRPGGLTFYPSPGPTLPGSTLDLPIIDGVAWLLHDPKTMTENRKSFADGAEGFLAHVENGVLFVKTWRDVPRDEQAPGEGEVELYVDKTGLFVEIEQQGPYQELAPGKKLFWATSWLVERLDPSVLVAPGSPSLLKAARRLAERYMSPFRDW
jgi:hypothetical protein